MDNIKTFKVIKVMDDNYKVVINAGANIGIKEGDRFLIYAKSDEELFDPITHKSLGCLEIVRGKGKVIHVQEYIATIESTETKQIKQVTEPISLSRAYPGNKVTEYSTEYLPFEDPEEEDLAKKI